MEELRRNMWTHVAQRCHKVVKVFPARFDAGSAIEGKDEMEFMLFGTVDYVLRSGARRTVDWAGHGVVGRASSADRWRFTYYRVYLQQ